MNQLLTFLYFIILSYTGFSQSPFLYRDIPTVATLPDMSNNIQFIDLDNDGNEDLINIVGVSIRIYKSNGDAIDSLNHVEVVIPNGHQISLLDWDQDGLTDIVTTVGSLGVYDLKILKNLGNFTFDTAVSVYNGYNPEFDVSDINADGYFDLVSIYNTQITIFENQGGNLAVNASSFTYPLAHLGSGSKKTILFEDVDSDGLKDMVFKSTWNKIYIYSHTGTYDYTLQDSIISNSIGKLDGSQSIFLHDLDSDGKNEIITRNGGTFNIFSWQSGFDYNMVYAGSATYTVSGGSTIATTIPLSDFYDVDQDGFLDIVAGNYVFFNNGDFTFNKVTINTSAVFDTPNYKCTDLNNDGNTDICYVYTISNLITSTSEYEAFFRSENITGQTIEPKQLVWHLWGYTNSDGDVVDFDNDGDIDVFGYNRGKTILWENINDTLFPKVLSSGLPYFTSYVDFIDINQDGYPDIVYDVLNDVGNDQHRYRLNQGGSGLGNAQSIANSDMLLKLIDDIDDDGIDELFYQLTNGSSHTVYMYKVETGVPVLVSSFSWTQISMQEAMIRIGDYNLDGLKDIVIQMVATSGSTRRLFIAKNNGGNNFSVVQNVSSTNAVSLIGIIDANGDSYPDIICHNGNNRIYSFKNNQGVISSSVSTISTFSGLSNAIGMPIDFNGDGLDDIVVQGFSSSGNQFLYRNNGNGFTHASTIPNARRFVRVQDIDNDGDEDIICTNAWYENTSNALFEMQGVVFYDVNENGIFDASTDIVFPYFPVELNSGWGTFYTDENGYFETSLGSVEGNYSFAIDLSVSTQFNATTTPYPSIVSVDSLNPQGNIQIGVSNLFEEVNGTFDVTLLGNRCNESGRIVINYQNYSPELADAQLRLVLAENTAFISSNQTPVQMTDTILWHLGSLNPFEHRNFYTDIQLPPTSSMGDTMLFYAQLILNGETLGSDTLTDQIQQILTCAYDPNDKNITMSDNVYFGDSTFLFSDETEYTIRFQNTGNDTAVNVTILDNLSNLFDWSSLRPISASHSYNFSIDSIGKISVVFNNINLPDSTTDFLGSMGYIKFRLDYRENAPHYVPVNNYAKIYFDQNPAIITNVFSFYRIECKDFMNVTIDNSLCEYESLQVSNTNSGFLQFNHVWTIDNQTKLTPSATFSGFNPGQQILNLKLFNHVCELDSNFNVIVYPKPSIELNMGDTAICMNNSLTISANYLVDWYGYQNHLGTSSELIRPYTSPMPIQAFYTENGCSDTTSIYVSIKAIGDTMHTHTAIYDHAPVRFDVCPDEIINIESHFGLLTWSVNYTNNPTSNFIDTSDVLTLPISGSNVVLTAKLEHDGCPYTRVTEFNLIQPLAENNLFVRIVNGPWMFVDAPLNLNDTTYICTNKTFNLNSPTKTRWYYNDSLIYYGVGFYPTQSGTYQVGCDKIPFTIILNQNEQISKTVYLCPGSNYTYSDGTTVSNIQINTTHVSTIAQGTLGCSTVTTTNLIIMSPTTIIETIQLCPGVNYTYPDGTVVSNFQSNSSHVSSLSGVGGCDSLLVTTNLEILTPVTSTETISLCSGSDYTYPDGTLITNVQSNSSYVSSFSGVGGCDSLLVTTNLEILTPVTSTETISLCSGSDYTYPDGTLITNVQSNSSYVSSLSGVGGCDSLIVTTNLEILTPVTSTETISLCSGSNYTYSDGTLITNVQVSSSHISHLSGVGGCDSIVLTTFIEVIQLDFTTNITLSSVEVSFNGTEVQWLDCNNNYALISGANSSVFHPAENGSYAAKIEYLGCTDTTECLIIKTLSIESNNQNDFSYFPNPVTENLTILLPNLETVIEIFVRDVNGRDVAYQQFENKEELTIPFSRLSNGVYIVTVRTASYEKQLRILKEL